MFLNVYAWPRIVSRQQKRQTEHQSWIDAAVRRRTEIAEWQELYQRTLDVAHASARSRIHKEIAAFEKEAEKGRHDFLNQYRVKPVEADNVIAEVKNDLLVWEKECLKILPFSSH